MGRLPGTMTYRNVDRHPNAVTTSRVVVLRMKRLRAVGSTAMAILGHFWSLLRERNIYLVVCGIEREMNDVMTQSGLRERIGEQNIFWADNKLHQSTELALARAWNIVPRLIPSMPAPPTRSKSRRVKPMFSSQTSLPGAPGNLNITNKVD